MSLWRIWTDEQGNPSTARVLLTVVVGFISSILVYFVPNKTA